jgi:hypothetical protein
MRHGADFGVTWDHASETPQVSKQTKGRHMNRSRASSPKEDTSLGRVIERPDGYYWQQAADGEEYGPFTTRAEAEADMLAGGGADFEPEETLQEAESEIGISEWIDPDTGEPAEESIPRLEEH